MICEEKLIQYSLNQLETANTKILNEVRTIARLSNLTLGINAAANPMSQENINLCYESSKTIDRLRKEVRRQAQILGNLKSELEIDFSEWNYGSEGQNGCIGRG